LFVYLPCSLLGVGLVCFFMPMQRCIGDGDYPPAEFQLTFKDETGSPVEGVVLRVEDDEGHIYYHYPMTDYLPDHTPASDRDGLLVFHHTANLIFSNRFYQWGPFEVETSSNFPDYVCRFVYQDAEVHRARFREMIFKWDCTGTVKRQWTHPTWPASELLVRPDEEWDEWEQRATAFFDLNHNGKLEREERAAYRAGVAAADALCGDAKGKEIEFGVIRKTITVRTPK
jgi:hypothetical protein